MLREKAALRIFQTLPALGLGALESSRFLTCTPLATGAFAPVAATSRCWERLWNFAPLDSGEPLKAQTVAFLGETGPFRGLGPCQKGLGCRKATIYHPRVVDFAVQGMMICRGVADSPGSANSDSDGAKRPEDTRQSVDGTRGEDTVEREAGTRGQGRKGRDAEESSAGQGEDDERRQRVSENRGSAMEKLLEIGVVYAKAAEEGLRRRAEQLRGFLEGSEAAEGRAARKPVSREPSVHPLESSDLLPSASRFLLSWLSLGLSKIVTSFVDRSFDEKEFLEGSKDAYFMVTHLFGEHDWETLKPMVSEKLFEVMKSVTEEYEAKGLNYSLSTEDIQSAFITASYLLDSNAMEKFYPSGVQGGKDDVWLLVGVRIFSRDRSIVKRPGGVVVSDDTQFRVDQWSFVRGPLGKLPVDETDKQWTLLSISQ